MSVCPTCGSGPLRRRAMSYLQWHDDNLLVVNRMPALVCENCNERIYDQEAVQSLQQLLWSPPPGSNPNPLSGNNS